MRENDGYFLLMADYIKSIEDTLYDTDFLSVPTRYYVVEGALHCPLFFTVTLSKNGQTVSDEYLKSISMLKVWYNNSPHFFVLNNALIEGNTRGTVGTLTLLYSEHYGRIYTKEI